MQKQRKKVIICGAGIGGLTTAHELSKYDFEVIVYERNALVGGLARSDYTVVGENKYPTEYSWRVYGNGYKNLLRVLNEIPLRENSLKRVSSRLVKITSYIFPRFNRRGFTIGKKKSGDKFDWRFSLMDYIRIADIIFSCTTMCTARMNARDDVRWKDYCAKLSPEARKFLVTFWGPALGMDPTNMSFPVVARFVSLLLGGLTGRVSALYLFDRPTNDAWFDEWTSHLLRNNVQIRVEHEVLAFETKDNILQGVRLKNVRTGEVFVDTADEFVCSLSVETAARLARENNELFNAPDLSNLTELAKTAYQIQLSVQIYLNQKLNYRNEEKLVLYLPDSPWAIIIEPEAVVWEKTYCTDESVKAVWSVGICQCDVPGIIYKKPFVNCTKKEIEEEVIAQISGAYASMGITMEDGTPVGREHVVMFYMWDSFSFDEKKGQVVTWEPKFSNNANAYCVQPTTATSIDNLHFATAYTKTQRFIYSMEAAAEAGIACANRLLERNTTIKKRIKIFNLQQSKFLAPLIWLDRFLFAIRFPQAGAMLGNATLLIIVYVTALIGIAVLAIRTVFY